MAYINIKIPLNYRKLLFTILFISWASGVLFYVFNNYITVEGDFGIEKHPWQYSVLMIHGAAAFAMMIFYGSLLTSHIPSGLKSRRLKKIGILLLVALGIQVISAYMLYYTSNDDLRIIVANSHAFTGFIFPFCLIIHIVLGVKYRRLENKKHHKT